MNLRASLVLLALALVWLCANAALAEVYRWTDAQGNLHFSQRLDQVPPEQREAAKRRAENPSASRVQTYSSAAAAASPASRRAVSRGGPVQIPFVRQGSLMRVDALINDQVTTPFLIDTGASGVSLPSHVAERLGIRIRSDTPMVQVQTANGVAARPVVTLRSVQIGGVRVENLTATVNPAMQIGLLGGSFFNNFIYRVDAARGVMFLTPNDGIRGGLRADEWRQRFQQVRDPLDKLDAYLAENPGLRKNEQAELGRRRAQLVDLLARLEREANRNDVPQSWRR